MRKPIGIFTIADQNNLKFYEGLKNSLSKFHNDVELVLVGPEVLSKNKDPLFFYRATPTIGLQLLEEYETVVKIDADSVICSRLDEAWNSDFDIGVVLNSNPREMKKLIVTVFDIEPIKYLNCGFVVMKNKKFVEKWLELCRSPHFDHYQYKEQDILNLMCEFGGWKTKVLDGENGFYGLSGKGYWSDCVLKDDKIMLPKNEEWNQKDVQIKVIHYAGGNDPQKGNHKLYFSDEVCQKIDQLLSQ